MVTGDTIVDLDRVGFLVIIVAQSCNLSFHKFKKTEQPTTFSENFSPETNTLAPSLTAPRNFFNFALAPPTPVLCSNPLCHINDYSNAVRFECHLPDTLPIAGSCRNNVRASTDFYWSGQLGTAREGLLMKCECRW
ncbi:hypothetical protein SLA2020_053500 [Shorea laevis]